MSSAVPLVLAIHTERLHLDEVWRRTLRTAKYLSKHGRRATFFVYPHRATVAGISVSDRIAELGGLGHEIAQHTHFYADDVIEGPGKRNDLSTENVRACLARDRAALTAAGFEPLGFVAGAWIADDVVLDELVKAGFRYDMSAHVKATSNEPATSGVRWLSGIERTDQGLLRIPTTTSLGQWWRRRHFVRVPADLTHEVVYLHDYDLTRRGVSTFVRALVRRVPVERVMTGAALAAEAAMAIGSAL